MQSAIMTGSFSQGFEQSKIARQTNVVKCCHCESPYSPQNFQFYYCCEPFKLDKLFCHACKGKKFACLNCRYRQQTIVIQPKNLGKLDEQYLKKAKNKVQVKLNKGNNSKTNTITINSQHDRCFNCSRNFRNEKIQSYCHRSCNRKMCFPCLFEVFYQQNKMFAKDSVIKKNYRMLMSCCETEGQKIMEIESLFKDNVCVFCGVCDQASQQWFIKIQKKICFCNQCYFKQRDRENSIVSVENILEFILKNSPKNCNYCQQPLKIEKDMKYDIIYFNEKLCRECSIYLPKRQQQISEFLINYLPQKASIIETKIKQLQTTECSQCMQRVVFLESSQNKQKFSKKRIQFDLIKWKNKKYYCSICLYFKYEKLRKQFESKRSKIMPVTEQQFDRLSLFKTIYQNHFTRRCLICSKQEQRKQSFIILNKKTKPLEWENLQLACRFCKKCAKFLIQQPQRYNRLKNIKLEMQKRDPNFLDQFQPEKQEINCEWNNKPLHVTKNIESVPKTKPPMYKNYTHFPQFQDHNNSQTNSQSQLPIGQHDIQNQESYQYRPLKKQTYTPKHYEQIRFSQLKFNQLLQFKSIEDEEDQKEENQENDKFNKGKISREQKVSRKERRLLRQEKQQEEKVTFKQEQQSLLNNKQFVESVINVLYSDNQNYIKSLKKEQNSSSFPHTSQPQKIPKQSPTKPPMPTQSLSKAPTDINTTPPSHPCKITACKQSTCHQLMLGLMCQDCFVRHLLFGKDLREEVGSEEFDRWKKERECLKKEIQEI